jgi:cation diffusion facilitator family transporter
MTVETNIQAEREKRRASLVSVVVVLALIILKVGVGLLTGSLAILAQAADSVLDMVAAVLAFFAVRAAAKPPDAEHPYGHGKVENLAGLGEALLLVITCGWIVYEAIQRLFFRPVAIESGVWGIAVMVLSIAASIWLSTYLMRVARRHRSQSLEGNALNFRADVLSSSVVILGLLLASLGGRLGPQWAWLARADAVAALVVAALVLRVSLGLGWRAAHELLDAAPTGLAERITAAAGVVSGVRQVGTVRVRQAGAATFVDMTVSVARSASLEEAHQVATEVEERVGDLLEEGDIVVHIDPVRQVDESLPQAVSAIAARHGLRTHNVHAHDVRGHYFVDLHVEVAPELTLAEAHQRVGQLEDAMRQELPHIDDIRSHIEPMAVPVAHEMAGALEEERLREQIAGVIENVPGLRGCHNLHVRSGPGGYDVVVYCLADSDLPVAQAHALADQAEKQLHTQVPGLDQVLIHVEPEESNP